MDDALTAEHLGDYWDHLVSGEPVDAAVRSGLDPTLTETVRHAQSMGALLSPPPGFAVRLWEELMQPSAATGRVPVDIAPLT